MATISNNSESEKEQHKYYCEKCDFNCDKKYNWDRHLCTKKHIRAIEGKILEILETGKWLDSKEFPYCCSICNKTYVCRTGLWRHNKICTAQNTSKEEPTNKELIKTLIEKQNELLNKFTEMIQLQTKLNECNLESLQNH